MAEPKIAAIGAGDGQNINGAMGEQDAGKFLRPAELPAQTTNGDAAKYLKSAAGQLDIKPVQRLGSIDIRKSKRTEWFRTHPEMFTQVWVIRKESTGDYYLLSPDLVPEVGNEAREAFLSGAVTDEGSLFLWPIVKPKGDGSGLQLFENDLADLSLSRTTWIRRQWEPARKSYRVDEIDSQKIPEWPENLNIVEWVEKAFKGRFIDDLGHPLLCRLRGEL